MQTKVINNWQGRLTRYDDGDVNSGYAKYATTFGNAPFVTPGALSWLETPTRIDAGGTVITDLIVASKVRLESGITYVYAIGHTGRLYKIQVNDPSTYQPNFDNPVLLTTLTTNSPTFKYGSSIQFFGATEKIFIGHDKGVTTVNFDGSGEAFVGVLATYTASVPRPSINFNGKLYFGNGTNILEIDSTSAVTTYTKLTPAFPVGTQVRDIDVSPDGNYVQIIVTRISQSDITSATQDTSNLSTSDSYFILWNGTDLGYTAYNPYNAYSLTANTSFGPNSYTFGYDSNGASIYSGASKVVTLSSSISPTPPAVFSSGNMVGFASPETSSTYLQGNIMVYGNYDRETPTGLFRMLRMSATGSQTDIIQIPTCFIVSNLFYGSSSAGYTNNQVGSAKLYFSTLETSSTPTTAYKLYKFTTVPTGSGTAVTGVYETQNEVFSRKQKISQVRVYCQPLVANNSFLIDIIGSAGTPIPGLSYTFTVGTNCSVGQDYLWYTPASAPTYVVAVRITNIGSANMKIDKVEFDYDNAGI